MKRLYEYLKEVIQWPASMIIFVVTALGFFGFVSKSEAVRVAVFIGCFLVGFSFRAVQVGYRYYVSWLLPVRVEWVQKASRYDDEAIYVILEKRSWIEPGQVFILGVLRNKLMEDLGAVVVESRIHGSEQRAAVLIDPFKEGVADELLDSRIWRSLRAQPIMRQDLYRLPRRVPHE